MVGPFQGAFAGISHSAVLRIRQSGSSSNNQSTVRVYGTRAPTSSRGSGSSRTGAERQSWEGMGVVKGKVRVDRYAKTDLTLNRQKYSNQRCARISS